MSVGLVDKKQDGAACQSTQPVVCVEATEVRRQRVEPGVHPGAVDSEDTHTSPLAGPGPLCSPGH